MADDSNKNNYLCNEKKSRNKISFYNLLLLTVY